MRANLPGSLATERDPETEGARRVVQRGGVAFAIVALVCVPLGCRSAPQTQREDLDTSRVPVGIDRTDSPDVRVPLDPDAELLDPAELQVRRPASCVPREWPLWERYKAHFVETDGRVVDHFAKHSTSEGQAYGMFLALVARDAQSFAAILEWARKHLSGGDLGANLPAWKWGIENGRGRVLDPNAASDADLWMAYALDHAAVVFGRDEYALLARRLLALIERREVVEVPTLGPMMLPGPVGFKVAQGYRLNPSYLPIQLLRWAQRVSAGRDGAPWGRMIDATMALVDGSTPHRIYADWVIWDTRLARAVADTVLPPLGSYDAIRCYLWPAMMAAEEPLRGRLLARGSRLLELVRTLGFVPEKKLVWEPGPGSPNAGPVGFEVVAQAFALAMNDERLAASLGRSVFEKQRPDGLYGEPAFYYDHNLLLFAQGYMEGRYAFRADGGLVLAREEDLCASR